MDRVADYVLLREVGRGAHGRVFLARAPERLGLPDPQVAVKVLSAPTDDDGLEAVAEELAVYADVGAPGLLRLYEVGLQDATVFYAMRHEPLGSLAAPEVLTNVPLAEPASQTTTCQPSRRTLACTREVPCSASSSSTGRARPSRTSGA